MRRNQYKERKDVLLKSLLRKFRKFYLDAYTSFHRIKFLQSPKTAVLENTDIFPDELEGDSASQLGYESLQEFVKSGFFGEAEIEGLTLFTGKSIFIIFKIGCLINPQDFKKQIVKGNISMESASEKKRFIEYCDLVQDVLYKFSYYKLGKFINVTEFEILFRHFDKAYDNISDDWSNKKFSEMILSYVQPHD